MTYAVGDVLLFLVGGVAGEGVYIGKLKANPSTIVLVVGKHAIEFDASDCSASGYDFSAEGEGLRQLYLKMHPEALV